MKKSLLLLFIGIALCFCHSREYKCCEDQKIIDNTRQAYILRPVNEYGAKDTLAVEEVYEIVNLKQQSEIERIALESFALANENRMYCCKSCAEKALERQLQQAGNIE